MIYKINKQLLLEGNGMTTGQKVAVGVGGGALLAGQAGLGAVGYDNAKYLARNIGQNKFNIHELADHAKEGQKFAENLKTGVISNNAAINRNTIAHNDTVDTVNNNTNNIAYNASDIADTASNVGYLDNDISSQRSDIANIYKRIAVPAQEEQATFLDMFKD